MVNQAIQNRGNWVSPLPQDQEEAQRKIMDAIHDPVSYTHLDVYKRQHLYRIILTINATTKEGEIWAEKAVSLSDTERHQKRFIRHCMRLWSSTFWNMALQNLSLATTADLTVLQRRCV